MATNCLQNDENHFQVKQHVWSLRATMKHAHEPSDRDPVSIPMLSAMLILLSDAEGSRQYVLKEKTRVGRSGDCEISISSSSLDPYQCEFRWQNGYWELADPSNTNRIRINGVAVEGSGALCDGDLVSMNGCEAVFALTTHSIDIEGRRLRVDSVHATNGFERIVHGEEGAVEVYDSQLIDCLTMVCDLARMAPRLSETSIATRVLQYVLSFTGGSLGFLQINEGSGAVTDIEQLKTIAGVSYRQTAWRDIDQDLAKQVLQCGSGILQRIGPQGQGGSILCVPITFGSPITGLIHIFSGSGSELAIRSLSLACVVGQAVGMALDSRRTFCELDYERARYAEALDSLRTQVLRETDYYLTPKNRAKLSAWLVGATESDLPLLIVGETGTGKAQLARRVHFGGERLHESFKVFDCRDLDESDAEALLFGSDQSDGSRTSAGLLRRIGQGTLLLGNIDALSKRLQARLRSVVDHKKILFTWRRYRGILPRQDHRDGRERLGSLCSEQTSR